MFQMSCHRQQKSVTSLINCQAKKFSFLFQLLPGHRSGHPHRIHRQDLLVSWSIYCHKMCLKLFVGGFDQHCQASVHFPLTSAIDKSRQHRNNFFGERGESNPRLLGEQQECSHPTLCSRNSHRVRPNCCDNVCHRSAFHRNVL